MVVLLDVCNYITVLESSHGQMLVDIPFADIIPNSVIV